MVCDGWLLTNSAGRHLAADVVSLSTRIPRDTQNQQESGKTKAFQTGEDAMLQSRISLQDQELATERRLKYRGTATIRLESLHFPCDAARELNRKNVERLKKCFRTEGCRRLELGVGANDLITTPLTSLNWFHIPTSRSHGSLLHFPTALQIFLSWTLTNPAAVSRALMRGPISKDMPILLPESKSPLLHSL